MDVVVAPATPWGHSALAVVRLSGDGLDAVVCQIVKPISGKPIQGSAPRRVLLLDEEGVFDDGLIIVGRAPGTYTGEDTAEITCHGNPQIVERLLGAAVSAGARMAGPGEFTRRAVQNGKMDLIRAEAVLQVSEATTKRGLDIGRSAMGGALSLFVGNSQERLSIITSEYEARMDYPGDELAYRTDEDLTSELEELARACRELAGSYETGKIWVHGARIALVGAVNAGKSSLFNQLLGHERALVHDQPGTTRDVVESNTRIQSVAVTLLDTAGERRTEDPVEAAGLALARGLIDEADLLVVVLRANEQGLSEAEKEILLRTEHRVRVIVYNGIDRPNIKSAPVGALETVANQGRGIEDVKQAIIAALVGEETGDAKLVIASARQRDLLLQVARTIEEGLEALPIAGVAVTADALTRALEELMALTGDNPREAVLDALFERFCIGK
jgi:tRNA modification GTPase